MSIIELSIAICLVGIVMILTMQGTALIQTVRGFVVSYQIEQIRNRVFVYQSQFSALPGDDAAAPARFGLPNAVSKLGGVDISFAGDSQLNGKLTEPLSPNGEQYMAWRQLRAAHLLEGDPALAGASAAPENPFGGIYGFDEGNLGQKDGSICATKVPGRAAEIIDKRLDDGVINKGRVVATSKYDPTVAHNHFDAPDSAPYNYDKQYIVCAPLLP